MGPRASSDMDERLQVLLSGLRHLILKSILSFFFFFISLFWLSKSKQ